MKKISLAVLGMFLGISNGNAQMTWNETTPLTAPFSCVGNDCTLATGSSYTGVTAQILADGIGTAGDQATLTLEGESSAGANDQAVVRYEGSTNGNVITLQGTNYLNIINNGVIEVSSTATTYGISGTTLLGSLTNNGDINGGNYGVSIGSLSGLFTNNGIVTGSTFSASLGGLTSDFLNTGTLSGSLSLAGSFGGAFTNSGDMTGSYGVYVYSGMTLSGDFLNQGAIVGSTEGVLLRFSTFNGGITNTGTITGSSRNGFNIMSNTVIAGDFINETGGIISGNDRGIAMDRFASNLTSENGGIIQGQFINRGTIYGRTYGVLMQWDATVQGNFINENSLSSMQYGVYTYNSNFDQDFINNGTISANTGIHLSRATSSGNSIAGVFRNEGYINGGYTGIYMFEDNVTGGIVNNGIIEGALRNGIAMESGNDIVLNYSGTGDIVSAGPSAGYYDINMDGNTTGNATYDHGDGNDTLNISNAELIELSVNSAETINITSSTLTLNITDLNKTNQIITTTGTTSLSLTNVIFDFDSTAAIITGGTDLFLMESTVIDPTNLGTLTANLSGIAFDGAFSIVNNGGIDELHFIAGGAAPVAPPAASGSTFTGGSVIATQVADMSQQAVDQRLQKKRQEFAALYSDSMYSIYEEPRSQVWAQGFGLSGSYEGEVSKGLSAYDTTLGGAVMGYDYNWGMMRTGIAATYATGQIQGDGNAFEIDVESFTGSLYSVIDFDQFYVETAASYGMTTFDQNLVGSANSYDSENMGALLRVGMKLHAGSFGLEPFAGFQYKNVVVEEHFNGVDTVAEYNQEMIKGEMGLTTSYQIMLDSGDAVVPYVRLETGHDFADNATLTSLDNSGAVIGNPASVNLGNWVSRAATGVSFLTWDNYSISGEYEYEFRDKYEAHIGKIKGRLMF
ncbi:MAG: hypothetical protein JXQ74_03585 [Alphaproteobacteria bacterium]|nr:hypothetical protein [Alphaproteobacteria bacterium]